MTDIGPYITLAVIIVIALALILVVVPLLTRLSFVVEALSLGIEGLGEYTGHPKLMWLGCLVFVMMCCGCAVLAIVLTGSLITCSSSNPAYLCRLIGR